jgi:hypothetical protein
MADKTTQGDLIKILQLAITSAVAISVNLQETLFGSAGLVEENKLWPNFRAVSQILDDLVRLSDTTETIKNSLVQTELPI